MFLIPKFNQEWTFAVSFEIDQNSNRSNWEKVITLFYKLSENL
jgi:hypothetical protein